MNSKLPEAKQFSNWVTDEVIPSIRKTGKYDVNDMNISKSNNKSKAITFESIYLTKNVSDFDGKNVVYMPYVGVYDGLATVKFGISRKMFNRDYNQHRNSFDEFVLFYIKETNNNESVEEKFKQELKVRNLIKAIQINGRNQTELLTLNDVWTKEKNIPMLDDIIDKNPLYETIEKDKEIEQLKCEIERLNQMVEKDRQIALLQSEIERLKANVQLQIQQEHTKQLELMIQLAEIVNELDPHVSVNVMALFESIYLNNNISKTKHLDHNEEQNGEESNHDNTRSEMMNEIHDLIRPF